MDLEARRASEIPRSIRGAMERDYLPEDA